MEQKEVKITCPEGYEIDKEKSTFECIKFKPIKNKLPKTWEEFCETHNAQESEYWITSDCSLQKICCLRFRDIGKDRNILPSKELAKAMLALCQLIQLRDCYNEGWTPDWTNNDEKYAIGYFQNNIYLTIVNYCAYTLTFKSKKLRDEFYNNFKDLIEIAKPLL